MIIHSFLLFIQIRSFYLVYYIYLLETGLTVGDFIIYSIQKHSNSEGIL